MNRTLHLERGTTLEGRYVLIRPIREGSGGSVWEAEDTTIRTRIALHFLVHAPDSADAPGRERMRRTVAAVSWPWFGHPNAVRVLRFSEVGGVNVAACELTSGETARARVERDGPLSPEEAVRVAAEIADAVEAGHRVGVAHGAVGSDTVLLTPGRAALLDLGLTPASWSASAPLAPGAAPWARESLPASAAAADVHALADLLRDLLGPTRPGDQSRALRQLLDEVRSGEAALSPSSAAGFAAAVRGTVRPAATPDGPPSGTGARPERSGHRRGLRVAAVAAVLAALIGVAALVQTTWGGSNGAAPSAPPHSPAVPSSGPPAGTVKVPAVTGLSATDAQHRLLAAGLVLSAVKPVAGTPGMVLRSDPQPGSAVAPESGVTLFVGTDPSRLSPIPGG